MKSTRHNKMETSIKGHSVCCPLGFLLFFLFAFSPLQAQIGTWHNYLAYYDIQQIQAAGDDLFVLASNDLYQYNQKDQSIVTYDKVNGLSDTHINFIRWCQQAKRLIAVYENSNIDLIDVKGNVINISSLYTKPIIGDKTVKSVRIDGIYAYLICGFGIVKVNMQRAEIADTYTIGHPEYPPTLPDEDNSDYEKYIDLVKTLNPGGPKYNLTRFLRFKNNTLYTCTGIMDGNFVPELTGTVQVFQNNEWTIFQDRLDTITGHEYKDLATVDADPTDNSRVFAAGRVGLYEFKNGKFVKEYNYHNSDLESNANLDKPSKDYTMVEGMVFDKNGSLWILNSASKTTSLFEITKEGEWINHHHKALVNNSQRSYDNMVNAMFDSRGILWFCNDRFIEPSLLCYQPSTKTAKAFNNYINQDGNVINIAGDGGVRCVAEDKEGNIWIGTSSGPLVLEKSQIGLDDYYFTQVKVPRNDGTNYADYLLNNIDINSIAIDGGGRKWFGTNGNGVYLISADNMTQIQHFTKENSPLVSDVIAFITIDHTTGEVFIGTDAGLCSYISDATETNTEMTKDNVWAYPNPVNPDYTGPITITGLTYNANVKILAANGAIVNEGHSNGGTYVWDGCDKKGRRVASGVYMVATATNDGNKGTVCKIAIIN